MKVREFDLLNFEENDKVRKIVEDNFFFHVPFINIDKNVKGYVCCEDEEILGFFILTKVPNILRNFDYYLLDYFCTDIDHHGMGVGNKMLQYIANKADEEKIEYVQLTCNNKRVCARHLYEKYGFELVDTNVFRRVLK